MKAIFQVKTGPQGGEEFEVAAGEVCRVGKSPEWSQFSLTEDDAISIAHFSVECDAEQCTLIDLNSRGGTYVNGKRVTRAVLKHGDRIVIGGTVLSVRFEGAADEAEGGAAAEGEAADPAGKLLDMLNASPEPLYVLLDGSRDGKVVDLISAGEQENLSLFEGKAGVDLKFFAPYLVSVPPKSRLLEEIVREGWGNSWGYFLTSFAPLYDVRQHLRQFLFVKDEDGKELYFRFYDPRILRLYLPTCTQTETATFFGPVRRFLIESEDAQSLLVFQQSERGIAASTFQLAGAAKA
ncbi:MAG: DUF4123 domain-containing protein [Bryobacterales bacterium]|nr:DUF4123 domain-containing protein [Bryobacterales bacterium]